LVEASYNLAEVLSDTQRPVFLAFLIMWVLAPACVSREGSSNSPSVSQSTTASSTFSVSPSQGENLQLRQVIDVLSHLSPDWKSTPLTCRDPVEAVGTCVASAMDAERIVLLRPDDPAQKYILGPVIVDGTDVVHATAYLEPQPGREWWSVSADLTAEAAKTFEMATEAAWGSGHPRDQIAIIVDGRIVSSPTVAAPISSGSFVITGTFTETQARSLASSLNGSG
jgi:preprotein translocase subunit SecD